MQPLRVLWLLPVIAAVALWMPRPAAAQEPLEVPSLTVRGQGTVSVRPDVALVTMGASVRRESAQEAFDAANSAVANLTAFLRAQGIAERDIATRQFSLTPEFGRQQGDQPAPLVAWRSVNTVSVKPATSPRSAASSTAPCASSAPTPWSPASASPSRTRTPSPARPAIRRSPTPASGRSIATAVGVRLVRIISITETSAPPPTPVPLAAPAPGIAAAPAVRAEVAPGEQTITVTVEIVYEIG
jgi:uncharacterized protein YggE